MQLPENLRQKLKERENQGILRRLKVVSGAIDFCSNDYLGLARSPELRATVENSLLKYTGMPWGATGSRLLSGNAPWLEETEIQIADFHAAEAALLFNSGYAANTGFFSAVPQRGDTILYDEASHASIKDGIRLSFAKAYSFRHNNLEDLQAKFKHATGQVYIAVESLYSMDGDFAPLTELAAICAQKGAYLVVDEAHATGLFGPNGAGLVQAQRLEDKVFARIMTFGKALGCHGAAVVGAKELRNYLINFSRPFIYTTALPLHAVLAIAGAYSFLPQLQAQRDQVLHLATYLRLKMLSLPTLQLNPFASPINAIRPPSVAVLKNMAAVLQAHNFDVRPIYSPTVPAGKEQLRLIVHAFNSEAQIDKLINLLQTLV